MSNVFQTYVYILVCLLDNITTDNNVSIHVSIIENHLFSTFHATIFYLLCVRIR